MRVPRRWAGRRAGSDEVSLGTSATSRRAPCVPSPRRRAPPPSIETAPAVRSAARRRRAAERGRRRHGRRREPARPYTCARAAPTRSGSPGSSDALGAANAHVASTDGRAESRPAAASMRSSCIPASARTRSARDRRRPRPRRAPPAGALVDDVDGAVGVVVAVRRAWEEPRQRRVLDVEQRARSACRRPRRAAHRTATAGRSSTTDRRLSACSPGSRSALSDIGSRRDHVTIDGSLISSRSSSVVGQRPDVAHRHASLPGDAGDGHRQQCRRPRRHRRAT